MNERTILLPAIFFSIFFCATVHAYPNKITVINASLTDPISAYATTTEARDISQKVFANNPAIFQGNNFTKIKVVGRVIPGKISGGASGPYFNVFSDAEDIFTFDKDISGPVTIEFNAGGKLIVKGK